MFDPPSADPYSDIPQKELDSPAHRALALRLAEESMVLLKNDGVLPLKQDVKRIAVVGPLANQTGVLLGNYHGTPTHTVTFLDGIKARFPKARITYVAGTPFLETHRHHPVFPANDAPDPAAVAAARNADVVIAVVGLTSHLESEQSHLRLPGFLDGDRTSLALPKPEETLVRAVAATGKPLIVVLMNGSALSVRWEKAHANAILETWYAGEEGGAAIAATLSGRNDPAGRLPVTFYRSVRQLPHFADYSMADRTYRYFKGKPLWPFGYGLSYTTFKYGDLTLPSAPIAPGTALDASVRVTNTGKVAGDEVVQLYLKFPDVPGAPIRALRGFQRIHLAPGQSQLVRFHLKRRDLSMVTETGDIIVAKGTYTVSVGGGQPGTGAPSVSGIFRVDGQIELPR
jgi:beta-glucosidase